MSDSVSLQLVVNDEPPLVLDSRRVAEGDRVGAYDLATICLETAMRLIVWQSTRDKFGDVLREAGEAA